MAEHPTEHLESYALRLLSPWMQEAIADHLGGCPACQALLNDIERMPGFLYSTAPSDMPPEGAEQRLFERVARLRAAERRPAAGKDRKPLLPESFVSAPLTAPRIVRFTRLDMRPARAVYALAGLAAVLLLVAGILGASLAAARGDNDRLAAQVRQQRVALAILGNPSALLRHLGATEKEAGAASGTLAVDPASGAGIVLLSRLPALPAGKTYELWVVQDVSGSLRITPTAAFMPTGDGAALVRFSMSGPASSMRNAGISIERAGAQPDPHSPMILLVQA